LSVQVHIEDPTTKRRAAVDDDGDSLGLVVATRQLKTLDNQVKFFSNPTVGISMATNAAPPASGDTIYTVNVGTPAEWATSAIVGTWDFAFGSPLAQSGSTAINATATVNNDVMQFTRESVVTAGSFGSLTGYIYITSWSGAGTKQVLVNAWDSGAGAIVGGPAVDIGSYVNTGVLNTWQLFTIPFIDLNITGDSFDAFRVTTVDIGSGPPPNYYLDTWDLSPAVSGSGPFIYTVEPDLGTWFHVRRLSFTLADNITNVPWDQVLGLPELSNGIIYQRIQDDEVVFSVSLTKWIDLMSLPGAELVGVENDGTNIWVKVEIPIADEIILKAEDEDMLVVTLSDDFSGLLYFQVSVGGGSESRLGA